MPGESLALTENGAEGQVSPECGQIEAGPEYGDTGDPAWIRPGLRERGARSGVDLYSSVGRWRERLYSDYRHPADVNPFIVGRVGLRLAVDKLWQELTLSDGDKSEVDPIPERDPIVLAMIATYEAMEWVHSLDDHLKADGRYEHASDIDPVFGGYVQGVIGARNASHHGLRRVLGVVTVARPIYAATGPLWVHTGTTGDVTDQSVRWLPTLPQRTEAKHADDTQPIYSARQLRAFEEQLAGREVRLTMRAAIAFFYFSLRGKEVPRDWTAAPSWHPPPMDPDGFSSQEKK